ncbi:MAG: hypothetical protein ACTSQN_18525 [Candidatus Heimdallarchaeota archaeon]
MKQYFPPTYLLIILVVNNILSILWSILLLSLMPPLISGLVLEYILPSLVTTAVVTIGLVFYVDDFYYQFIYIKKLPRFVFLLIGRLLVPIATIANIVYYSININFGGILSIINVMYSVGFYYGYSSNMIYLVLGVLGVVFIGDFKHLPSEIYHTRTLASQIVDFDESVSFEDNIEKYAKGIPAENSLFFFKEVVKKRFRTIEATNPYNVIALPFALLFPLHIELFVDKAANYINKDKQQIAFDLVDAIHLLLPTFERDNPGLVKNYLQIKPKIDSLHSLKEAIGEEQTVSLNQIIDQSNLPEEDIINYSVNYLDKRIYQREIVSVYRFLWNIKDEI